MNRGSGSRDPGPLSEKQGPLPIRGAAPGSYAGGRLGRLGLYDYHPPSVSSQTIRSSYASLNERTSRRKVPHTINIGMKHFVAGTEAPEAELIRAEAAVQMHNALELVRPDHRAAIVLRELEGLTYQETAESLGIAEGTAKSVVHRGWEQLKRILIAA